MPRSHECPGGCGVRVGHDHLACRDCWYRLPQEIRQRVSNSFRHNNDRHRAALQTAVEWYVANPLQ